MHLRRLAVLALFASLALSLGGCAAIQKALGLKTDLQDKPVKKLELDLVGTEALCPGASAPLIVTAVLDDGKRLMTEGAGQGKVTWDNYKIQTVGGQMARGGNFVIDGDPRVTLAKPAKIIVRSVHHPKKTVEATVPARYDCGFVANFSGQNGRNGANGRVGSSGRNGQSNQSSGSYAEPGGHGGDGQDGGHGQDGEPGQDADDVVVYVKLAEVPEGDKPLLKVRAESQTSNHVEVFLVDPEAGGLKVVANGGHGGHGGNGGSGGKGGSGGTGAPAGNGGNGGNGGDGGNGAAGGDGGAIKLVVDPAAKTYLKAITLENEGGQGGQPGTKGYGGSGGTTFSGGQQGQRGQDGRSGTRVGRDGKSGPEPQVTFQSVAQVW
ncbi:hypothetical protein FIV42_11860 [Persicimonas caeni]|uniref:Collagen-like protein n=1 Tax=Persicimonas caeni TaxID=2292766 RepID=A0A4Y6PSU6_PERCE|nr:hypothetical protein [Persicimonas caeni]QDG51411.1 hypothetical protein FIV42_11860 [Persicimonas caeni]QED32632.1 hypothetical protein FRD00_11855 [Persicimonas caeni]